MKLVDVDPLIVKLNEAQIEGTDTYKGLGLAKDMLIRAKGIYPSTDAISREEALKEMQKYHDDCAKTSEYTRLGFETAMNVVRDLPPVTPERPKGSGSTRTKCMKLQDVANADF